jgi:alanyl-tRNA synthetase
MSIQELQDEFNRVFKALEQEQEQYWSSLSKEDQLKCFCAVARRIFKGEIEKQGTYRYVLYDVFGFGPEAYAQAQMAGYLAIHNSIMPDDYDSRLLEAFCSKYNIENSTQKIRDFLL